MLLNDISKSGLNRMLEHTQGKHGNGQFAMLTSWRANPHKEGTSQWHAHNRRNQRNLTRLHTHLKRVGLKVNKLTGHWDEGGGPKKEPSLFVHGIGAEHAKRIGKIFKQDAVIHGHAGQVTLHHLKDASQTKKMGAFSARHVADAYTKTRGGKNFTFKALIEEPEGSIAAMGYYSWLRENGEEPTHFRIERWGQR